MSDINENVATNNATESNGSASGTEGTEKLFTQEDLDKIIGQRLIRERQSYEKNKNAEIVARELRLDAREKLADAGLPKEYLDVINCSTVDTIDKSIEALSGLMSGGVSGAMAQQPGRGQYRISTGTASSGANTGRRGSSEDDIKKAMGLR